MGLFASIVVGGRWLVFPTLLNSWEWSTYDARMRLRGPAHLDVADSLNDLAYLYMAQGEYSQAEPFFKRALPIWEKVLGPDHPNTAMILKTYASLLRKMERMVEADKIESRVKAMRSKDRP